MSTAPKIRREVTRDGQTVRYVHSFCTACPYWFAFEFSIEQSYEQGSRHLINVHDVDPKEAQAARRKADERARTTKHEIRSQS